MASVPISPDSPEPYVEPAEVYKPPVSKIFPVNNIGLRIATGGAGQSGILKALACAFMSYQRMTTGCQEFCVAWLMSDTSASFNYLAQGAADLSITYHAVAEDIAMQQGIADRREYAWKDHWMIVGPKSNPAKLPIDATNNISAKSMFSLLFQAAVSTSLSAKPVKFLSRYDKSAANIKESELWTSIGQTPWAHPMSTWYHRYTEFPFQALRAASVLEEYTLTDRGTWMAIEPEVRERMTVFKCSTDAETDRLLNPAHILVGTRGKNRAMAHSFADWMVKADGGQKVIAEFQINGRALYSTVT